MGHLNEASAEEGTGLVVGKGALLAENEANEVEGEAKKVGIGGRNGLAVEGNGEAEEALREGIR